MKNDINQIPLNMSYIWAYDVIPDECEDYGPTLLFNNMPETMSERIQMYQEFGEDASYYLCERCWDPQKHIGGY